MAGVVQDQGPWAARGGLEPTGRETAQATDVPEPGGSGVTSAEHEAH